MARKIIGGLVRKTPLNENYEELYNKVDDLSQLQDQVAANQDDLSQLQDQVAANQDDLSQLQDQVAANQNDFASYKDSNNLKVAKVEKELNDYQKTMSMVNINQEATQTATGYGIVSLPKNAANGQVSASMKGNTYTQLIKNGNFSKGATDWLFLNATYELLYNYNIKITGALGYVYQNIYGIQGEKWYVKYDFTRDTEVGSISLLLNESTSSAAEDYNKRQIIANLPSGSPAGSNIKGSDVISLNANHKILGFSTYPPPGVDRYFRANELFAVNLTATFGAGNEPTKEECDKIFSNYFDGTKSTISASRLKSVGKNLLSLKSKKIIDNLSYTTTSRSQQYFRDYDIIIGATRNGYIDSDRVDIYDFTESKIDLISTSSGYGVGIKFKAQAGEVYVKSDNVFGIGLFDKDGNNLAYTATFGKSVTAPTNTAFGFAIISTEPNVRQVIENFQVERGNTATPYEPYTESNAYVVAKDSEGKIVELRSLPNGTKDEISIADNKLIKRVSNEVVLNGQLAEPIEVPIQVSGTLLSNPSGTVYVEPVVADAGVYGESMAVLHQDLPIRFIEKVSKVNFTTGIETTLDASTAVIAEDKLSFAHPDLIAGDIVFFEYEYDRESTVPETEIEYYDSRYVLKDDVTGKYYKVVQSVSNGELVQALVEV